MTGGKSAIDAHNTKQAEADETVRGIFEMLKA